MQVSQLQAILLASNAFNRELGAPSSPARQAEALTQAVIRSSLESLPNTRGSPSESCAPDRARMYATLTRILTTLQLLDELFTMLPVDPKKDPASQEKTPLLFPELPESTKLLKLLKQTRELEKNRDLPNTSASSRAEAAEPPAERPQSSPSGSYAKGSSGSAPTPVQSNTTENSGSERFLPSTVLLLSDPRLSTHEERSSGPISDIMLYDHLEAAIASLTEDTLVHLVQTPLLRDVTKEIRALLEILIQNRDDDQIWSGEILSDLMDHLPEVSLDSHHELDQAVLERRGALMTRFETLRSSLFSILDRTSYQHGLTVELNRMPQSHESEVITSIAQVARLLQLGTSTLDERHHMASLLMQAVPMLDPNVVSRLISLLVKPDRLHSKERTRSELQSRERKAHRKGTYVVDERAIERRSENDTNDSSSKDTLPNNSYHHHR